MISIVNDSWKETDGNWQLKGNWWEMTVERKLMGIDSWKETDGKWQLKGNWWEMTVERKLMGNDSWKETDGNSESEI